MIGIGVIITLAIAIDKVGRSLFDDFILGHILSSSQGTHGQNGGDNAEHFHFDEMAFGMVAKNRLVLK